MFSFIYLESITLNPITPNSLIGLVSPASFTPDEVVQKAITEIERRGYRTRVFGCNAARAGRFAATDNVRRDCIEAAFRDPEVDAILCIRGGYGSSRIADMINYDLIRSNPKPFIGYSDITGLMIRIMKETGMPCFHGPMAIDFAKAEKSDSIDDLLKVVSGNTVELKIDPSDLDILQYGCAEGCLFGGNITVIESIIGTGSFFVPDNCILFLEDINEFMYKFDRSIQHLKRIGLFDKARAVIFADMEIRDEGVDNSLGFDSRSVIEDCLSDYDIPLAINVGIGHTINQATLPVGTHAELSMTSDGLSVQFPQVWSSACSRFQFAS